MTSADRKSGVEGVVANPWEAARFGDPTKPDEAFYRVKVTGTEDAKGLTGYTFYGYFDTKSGEQTSLHLPILGRPDLQRLLRRWKKEGHLFESVGVHNEGALAYLNATNNISLKKGIHELQNLRKSTNVYVRSEQHRDPNATLFRHPISIVITRPHLDLRFLPTTTPYAVGRLAYGLSTSIPFSFTPLTMEEFYPRVETIFSKR